ncbi:hypothetical protein HMI54_003363 [Coelomomyces lativittatus]|nr:hypothetical protein HMI54_003363 [Coelomomyces lativittatus]KAJ1511741.1 hypothetical protein HMI56_005011 [Coelomomyces lativittatus]
MPLPRASSSCNLIWDSHAWAPTAPVPLISSCQHHHPTPQPPASFTTNIHPSVLNPLFSHVSNVMCKFLDLLLVTWGTLYMRFYALQGHGQSIVYCSIPGY